MDNSKNKAARKVRELTSHLEEEDLWDLEDSWDDDDDSAEETENERPEESPDEETEAGDPAEEKTETPDLFDQVKHEEEETEAVPDEAEGSDEDDDIEVVEHDLPEPTEEPEQEEAEHEEPTPDARDTFDDTDLSPEEAAKQSAAELIQKAGLSTTEKIALAAVALMFASLAIWGYMFLHKHNHLGKEEAKLDLPIKGKQVTVSGFETFWQTPDETSGVRLGAQVVPAATITLSDDSSGSGALRLYFLNTDGNSVGDPITIAFDGGAFPNGEKTIQVSASDGFHQEGDFNAYVLDRDLAWKVQLLEAGSANASGSDFEELLETVVEPVRK